ncbi:uncharacterized protein LOC117290533 [Asterias rubens]|uniref:uncharacterized protein LOC117290533 n=1 Tax=Asterias rubens TaxID=7604 RepID=UPI001455BEB3|nr:uncharacterized protein LOC117290533 [Asterias rubens]XP_033627856.1 uncharacterized protein LOC117290533 [Asterias rubens]
MNGTATMRKYLLFLLIFGKVLAVTKAFECWKCNSKDNEECRMENPYLESKLKETCSDGVTSCIKITGGVSDITYRQCSAPTDTKCFELSFDCIGDDPCILNYCCKHGLCNGASLVTFDLSFYTFVLITMILFK